MEDSFFICFFTRRVEQPGEGAVETDPNLHVVVLAFRFDICKINIKRSYRRRVNRAFQFLAFQRETCFDGASGITMGRRENAAPKGWSRVEMAGKSGAIRWAEGERKTGRR